jgi:nucleoside-diphosphate-sugar epimerase
MAGTDGVFHLGGWYKVGVEDKGPAFAINIDGTRNVLDVMKVILLATEEVVCYCLEVATPSFGASPWPSHPENIGISFWRSRTSR